MYFTGRQHAGENIADVLNQRAKGLSPVIQMCDALSRNVPALLEMRGEVYQYPAEARTA